MFLTILSFLWLIHLSVCQFESLELPDCGLTTLTNRTPLSEVQIVAPIHGGRRTTADEVPWIVKLEITRHVGQNSRMAGSCSGVLLNHRFIITAAHCLTHLVDRRLISIDPDDYPIIAHLGLAYRDQRHTFVATNVTIDGVFIHPDYWQDTFADIGLVRTAQPIEMLHDDNRNYFIINSICLPRNHIDFNRTYSVAGYGNVGSWHNDDLMVINDERLIDKDECVRQINNFRKNLPRPLSDITIASNALVCSTIDNRSTCHGDSGGPVFSWDQEGRNYLFGVIKGATPLLRGDVSQDDPNYEIHQKYPCGYYDVYVDVYRHSNWIRETMERNMTGGMPLWSKILLVVFVISLILGMCYFGYKRFYAKIERQAQEQREMTRVKSVKFAKNVLKKSGESTGEGETATKPQPTEPQSVETGPSLTRSSFNSSVHFQTQAVVEPPPPADKDNSRSAQTPLTVDNDDIPFIDESPK